MIINNIRFILVLLCFCNAAIGWTQKGKEPKVDNEYLVYKKAMQYGDLTVARTSVIQLIVKYPEKTAWKDTLISIYGMMGMYDQTILLGEEILKSKPNDTVSLRLMAYSYESLGMLAKAIEYYEKVLALGEDVMFRYKLSVCQYGMQRYGEAMANVEKVMSNKSANERKITINYETSSQEVVLLAAALNAGGIILTDNGKLEEAKFYFEGALKLEPNFILAQNNLKVVVGLMEKGK